MRPWGLLLMFGCFHPSPPAGAPCGANGECPGGLVCDQTNVCVETPGAQTDGSVTDDGPIGVDAPPSGACVADEGCASGVCHEHTGECVDEAAALYASPTGTGTACSRQAPCTLAVAVQQRTTARYTIALAPGTHPGSWDTTANMGGGVPKLVISGPTRTPDGAVVVASMENKIHTTITATIEGVTLRGALNFDGIDNRGTTTVVRVRIENAGDYGIVQRFGTLHVIESTITKSKQDGVYAMGGDVTIERSHILENTGYGVNIESGFTIKNTVIASNGSIVGSTAGALLDPPDGATAVFKFNTLAKNRGTTVPSVDCASPVRIESSIIAEQPLSLMAISTDCTATYSLFVGFSPGGATNVVGDPLFLSATDYHLQATSPALGKANPTGVEPLDIDGQMRSSTPDIGADERL